MPDGVRMHCYLLGEDPLARICYHGQIDHIEPMHSEPLYRVHG